MNIARAIRFVRLARGVSQHDLADRVGISPSYLSLMESGKKEPSLSMIRSLARGLDISDDLLLLSAIDYSALRSEDTKAMSTLADELLALMVPTMASSASRSRKK